MKQLKLFTVLIISVIAVITLTSCEPVQINTQTVGSFTEVECGKFASSNDSHYTILVHNETGVYYLVTNFIGSDGREYRGGITVLLNADGTPYTGK